MLTPSGKALDLFETRAESLQNSVNKLLLLGDELDPEPMNVGNCLFVFLDVNFFFLSTIILFLNFVRVLIGLQLNVVE